MPWTQADHSPAFTVERLPGEAGPILQCSGELTATTAQLLQRELDLLEPLAHPAILIDLSDCGFLDVEGILTLLESFKRRRQEGRQVVVVAATGPVGRLLRIVGLDNVVPIFPSEEVAMRALRGDRSGATPGAAAPASANWAWARQSTLARWRAIREALDELPIQEVLRILTSMTALCERSEELFQAHGSPGRFRCQFCPLYHTLGAHPEAVGCRSLLDPIIAALQAGDRETGRELVTQVLRTIDAMPLPEEDEPAAHGLIHLGFVPPDFEDEPAPPH